MARKLVDGQHGTRLLLDTDGHLYSRRADRETLVTSYWRCQKQSLKRKASDQHLSATQNLLIEALSGCSSDLNVELPKLESLARVVQRSRAVSSGSANHSEVSLARTSPKFPVQFWNHYSTIMVDPDYPRTSNLVEGFHRGFETRVNRARPTVQEYFRAIREQQVTKDFHLDRLAVGLTPSKKRKTSNRD
ncbi:hypothetical protein ACHWQZ_G014902 [Mnemiopsis leidyi]